MPEITYFQCDVCGKQEIKEEAVNWLKLSYPLHSIVRWTGSDKPLTGLFCSPACLKVRIDDFQSASHFSSDKSIIYISGVINNDNNSQS